jgi:hypothetical protein
MQYIVRVHVLVVESQIYILPMFQKFTQENSDEYCFVMGKKTITQQLNPRKETLILIRQFAGAYHVEKKLPAQLMEIILN